MKIQDIIQGTDEGLRILDEMLQAKKDDHYRRTGQVLEITQEEFYDMMRRELGRQVKELQVLIGVMTMFAGISAAEPPEDATDLEKNRYKYLFRMVDKFKEEILFFYDPRSFESITRGHILPSVGILSKGLKVITTLEEEARGRLVGDEQLTKDSHPMKYFFNLIPIAAQVQSDILPNFFPEVAKDMGIRVTKEARRQ